MIICPVPTPTIPHLQGSGFGAQHHSRTSFFCISAVALFGNCSTIRRAWPFPGAQQAGTSATQVSVTVWGPGLHYLLPEADYVGFTNARATSL